MYNYLVKAFAYICIALLSIGVLSGCSAFLPPDLTQASPETTLSVSTAPQISDTPSPTHPASPTHEPLPVAPGEIWLINETDHALLLYDSQTLAQKAAIVHDGNLTGLIQGKYGVWVIDSSHQTLLQIDPLEHVVAAQVTLPGYSLHSLAASAEGIWVGVQPEIPPTPVLPGSPPGGGLALVNPITLEIVKHIELGAPVSDVEVYGGWIWAITSGNGFSSLVIINPKTFSVAQPEDGALWYGSTRITVNYRGVWLINEESPTRLVLLHMQPEVKPVQIPLEGMRGRAVDVQATETGVWVLSDRGELLKVNTTTNAVEAVLSISKKEASLVASEEMIWIISQWDGMIYAVSPVENRVMVMVITGSRKPTPTRTPTVTPYPTEAQLPACTAGFETRLKVGARAIVESESALPNRIRAEAGLDGKVLGFVQQYEEVQILAGPICRDNWIWWKVRSEQSYIVGWTAEGDEETYWLQPLE